MAPIPDLDGVALQPSDPGFADECLGYNRLVTHRPEVVVGAASAHDVVAAVRHAREHDWSVGVAATGHGPTRPVSGVLVTTRRMTGVSVDPDAGTATVQAGTRAGDVVAAAAKYGLAPLNGSSPNVGFVGYTLGGGVPLLGRRYGNAADRVRRIELVTAEGEQRTLHRDDGDPLLWAVLGGKDNFGIVTELEVDLVPAREITGGGLWWTGAVVPDAVRQWVRWTGDLPDNLGSSVLVITMPDLDVIPAPTPGTARRPRAPATRRRPGRGGAAGRAAAGSARHRAGHLRRDAVCRRRHDPCRA